MSPTACELFFRVSYCYPVLRNSNAEILQRGRDVEAPSSSKYPPTPRRDDAREQIVFGLRVDGSGEYQRIPQIRRKSRSESYRARKVQLSHDEASTDFSCISQLVNVADGLSHMHGLHVVHGNLKGVRHPPLSPYRTVLVNSHSPRQTSTSRTSARA